MIIIIIIIIITTIIIIIMITLKKTNYNSISTIRFAICFLGKRHSITYSRYTMYNENKKNVIKCLKKFIYIKRNYKIELSATSIPCEAPKLKISKR